jgi:multidrug efflux pump subunit AcrB
MLREEDRRSLEDLSALTVGVENGAEITLDQVAELHLGRAASRIRRVDQRTAVTVTAS